MTTLDAAMADVEKAPPDDPVPLLLAADLADEGGDRDLAEGLRWAALYERRPVRYDPMPPDTWRWEHTPNGNWGDRPEWARIPEFPSHLPPGIYDVLPTDNCGHPVYYESHASCYRALGVALREVRTFSAPPSAKWLREQCNGK